MPHSDEVARRYRSETYLEAGGNPPRCFAQQGSARRGVAWQGSVRRGFENYDGKLVRSLVSSRCSPRTQEPNTPISRIGQLQLRLELAQFDKNVVENATRYPLHRPQRTGPPSL
jgi:hypothetical protein